MRQSVIVGDELRNEPKQEWLMQIAAKREQDARQWARNNYTVGTPIPPTWKPVIQAECVAMNNED